MLQRYTKGTRSSESIWLWVYLLPERRQAVHGIVHRGRRILAVHRDLHGTLYECNNLQQHAADATYRAQTVCFPPGFDRCRLVKKSTMGWHLDGRPEGCVEDLVTYTLCNVCDLGETGHGSMYGEYGERFEKMRG
jgi:hypothetical protein